MKLWCNGSVLDADAARIDPADRGFTLGDGVFETVLVSGGEAVRLGAHLARLHDGAAVLGIPINHGAAEIAAACNSLLSVNAVDRGAIRITLSRGPAGRGLATPADMRPTLLIAAYPGASSPDPVMLVTARSTRRNEYSPLSRIKSLNYLDGVIARREAEALGADDALMLNTAGLVAESTIATVLAFADNQLWTPRVIDGALPGIARATLLAAGAIQERPIDPDWMAQAECLFLCNSLGVRPVSALDGRAITVRPGMLERLRMTLWPDLLERPAPAAAG